MKALILAALAGLILAVPATAQEACPEGQTETPEGCSQQAWVDDCPPDMMCAASSEEPADGNATDAPRDDGPTYGDCGGEVCAYDDPVEYGDGDPWDTGVVGPTCMDGQQEGEFCDDELVYLTPGSGDGEVDVTDDDTDPIAQGQASSNDAPLAGYALVALGIVGAALVARRFN